MASKKPANPDLSQPCTPEDFLARATACEEAADHLDQNWTDDPFERIAGNYISKKLRRDARSWHARARKEGLLCGSV